MPLWVAVTSFTDGVLASVCLHTFPHKYILPISFILQCAQLRLLYFVQGRHFPAVRDWSRQAPLAENGPGTVFGGDTYLRDRCEEKAPRALLL